MSARPVMEVRVVWLTEDSDEDVEQYMRALDEGPWPSPAAWVANGLDLGAQRIQVEAKGSHGEGFRLVVEGPDHWSKHYQDKDKESEEIES